MSQTTPTQQRTRSGRIIRPLPQSLQSSLDILFEDYLGSSTDEDYDPEEEEEEEEEQETSSSFSYTTTSSESDDEGSITSPYSGEEEESIGPATP